MKKYFILAAAALTLAACSNDESDSNKVDSNIISLSAQIGGGMRASSSDDLQNTQFKSGAEIFVEAYKTGVTDTYTTGNYTTTDAAGTMSGTLYYPTDNSNIGICAYYPSSVKSSSTEFSVQATQNEAGYQASDLMYATKLTNLSRGTTHALTFNHALAKVIVNITNGDGVTADDITANVTAVKINNTVAKAKLTISGGAITATKDDATDASDINIFGTGANSEGIIIPQEVAAGTFITVTYNGRDYTYSLDAAKTFSAGTVYTYSFTLNAAGISLSTTSITNWTSGEGATPSITL